MGTYPSTHAVGTGYNDFVPNEGDAIVQTDLKNNIPKAQKRDWMMGRVLFPFSLLKLFAHINHQCNDAEILAQGLPESGQVGRETTPPQSIKRQPLQ